MPIRRGVVAASITELPTVSIGSVTNFNQERATFNATVSANYQSTTVKFQYNTTNNFSSFTEVTATGSPVTGQSVAVYFNATGLSVGTTYYVRAVISNGIGTVTTSSTSFTTWSLKTYAKTTAGTFTNDVHLQTITPTGGSAITPSIFNIFFFGGGGGGAGGGGGGGGYYINTGTVSATSAVSSYLTITVGGGGAAGDFSTSTNAGAGGTTTISGSSFSTLTATGGGGGLGNNGNISSGGASGSGTSASYAGGTGSITSTGSGKSIVYYTAAGGGGGNFTAGENGHTAGNGYGGSGGFGGQAFGYYGGSGGGGSGSTANGTGNRILFDATPGVYGCGGGPNAAGTAGMCYFQYYGP
jgi:hypothetical protein